MLAIVYWRETFSCHGDSKLKTSRVTDLVQGGPISSGSFSSFLADVFSNPMVKYDCKGQYEAEGRVVVTFGYELSLTASHWSTPTLHRGKGNGLWGYVWCGS